MSHTAEAISQSSRPRWFLPSLSWCVWLAFFLGLMVTDWRVLLINADGDPCWHWRQGQWMIEHGTVLRSDVFSHTQAGAPVVAKEWLSQVIFAVAGNLFGWNGVVLVAALVIATTLWLLHRQLLAENNDLLVATGLVLLAGLTASQHWLARPHLWTHLAALVFAWQLRWFDCGRINARQLALRLVPVMMLWANLHGGFAIGFLLLGLYLAGNAGLWLFGAQENRLALGGKLAALAVIAFLCAVATLANPNGWKLHRHIGAFIGSAYQVGFTDEWRSANFHTPAMRGFRLELLVLGLLLLVQRPRWSVMDVALAGCWTYLGLLSVRNIPICAFVVTPIFAEHLTTAIRAGTGSRWQERLRAMSADVAGFNRAARGGVVVVLVVLVMLAVVAKPRLAGGEAWLRTELLPERFPQAAVKFVTTHRAELRGRMFNDNRLGWGSYLMLALPDQKVFLDGRNDFYPEAFLKECDVVADLKPGWETVLDKYQIKWVLLRTEQPLSNLLRLRNDWTLLYRDELACIYRRGSTNAVEVDLVLP